MYKLKSEGATGAQAFVSVPTTAEVSLDLCEIQSTLISITYSVRNYFCLSPHFINEHNIV